MKKNHKAKRPRRRAKEAPRSFMPLQVKSYKTDYDLARLRAPSNVISILASVVKKKPVTLTCNGVKVTAPAGSEIVFA